MFYYIYLICHFKRGLSTQNLGDFHPCVTRVIEQQISPKSNKTPKTSNSRASVTQNLKPLDLKSMYQTKRTPEIDKRT